uniref:Uncharacterized protein n=1 Tax=Timema shepardi TaxID=629360 RepID=A0A7R9B565_TIMSH|nr:unnamed protein product [Timema shepardi]
MVGGWCACPSPVRLEDVWWVDGVPVLVLSDWLRIDEPSWTKSVEYVYPKQENVCETITRVWAAIVGLGVTYHVT